MMRVKINCQTCRALLLVLTLEAMGCQRSGSIVPSSHPTAEPAPADTAKVDAPGMHNVYRLTDQLYSGSYPEGEEGFHTLQKLGIKTILSVDGARPEVALAKKYGLRYVHIPVGYDGIPRAQALRIARAVRDLPGPFYIHCHRGTHRGPAAAAVAHLCLDDQCSVETVVAEMRRAGTDPRYQGLYAAPREFRRPTPEEWERVPADLPEAAPVAALAEFMVAIDGYFEGLKQAHAAGWKTPSDHPDIDPPHEALQLLEQFREVARLPAVHERPEEFRRYLTEAESATQELEMVLRLAKTSGRADGPSAEAAFKKVEVACLRCHGKFRDVPRRP